ncbi:MAG: cyclic-di-AMP receptor [Clostridiaceae bacterium]
MKLLFAIVQNDDQKALTYALVERSISVTRIASTGGFLRGGNTTLMIGVEAERLDETLAVIKEHSSRRQIVTVPAAGIPHNIDSVAMPMTVTVGGATVFILDVSQSYKF